MAETMEPTSTTSTPDSGKAVIDTPPYGGIATNVVPQQEADGSFKQSVKDKASSLKDAALKATENVDWKAHSDQLVEQATKTARSAAGVAKDKTGVGLQSLSKLISDTAGTVDAKLGPQYGDYARYAAEAVAGAAKSLDEKDVDQIVTEARDFVRKSPAVAIGAAAVVGFVLMRLAKGSSEEA